MDFKWFFENIVVLTGVLFALTFLVMTAEGSVGAEEQKMGITGKNGLKIHPSRKNTGTLVFEEFTIDPQRKADYPGAIAECKNSAVSVVKAKKLFEVVDKNAIAGRSDKSVDV